MEQKVSLWAKFIKFITFINLPIKKKFLLFGLGTFFWFAVIAIFSIFSLTFVHYRHSQISNNTIPQIQIIQTISSKLQNIEQLLKWAKADKEQEKYLLKITFKLRQIQGEISKNIVDFSQNRNNNIFETLTYTLAKDDPIAQQNLRMIIEKINNIDKLISANKKDQIWDNIEKNIKDIKIILEKFSKRANEQLKEYTIQINETIKYAINAIAIVFFIAVFLLWFFTRWLTEAFSRPIESMIHQIHSIGTGEVDLNKKLK